MPNRPPRERIDREPIAIVGIGCRYPGGVDSPDRFWRLLYDGVDAIEEIPADRLVEGSGSDDGESPNGKVNIRQGGYLRDIDRFDAEFFGISPREAEQLDPQQRLLLETAWEALEDAGIAREHLAGSRAGVYIGLWLNDFEDCLYSAIDEVELHTTTGGGRYPTAGRLSFALDLRGPSLTVDTACSSSLVAVHLAVQALRSGETDLSLAGGVNVILQPQISVAYSRSGMLAPDGRSKFGDARANGYVRSEGCGVVVLKRLSDALADGDPIYALIRGSAINNDGQGSGFLVQPSVDGQTEMLRTAYADAGVNPGSVSYVEAHGTGTLAGDPVELQAIGAVLGEGRAPGDRCLVGSVKTNFGHTEGAAGVAGLIKVALSLKHGAIPPSLHFQEPSPRIPWDDLPVAIPTEVTPLPNGDGRNYAGVSAFGITGTNAHIVLESAPVQPAIDTAEASSDAPVLLPLSAHSPSALRQLTGSYASYLRAPDAPPLADVVFTAATRRSQLSERLTVVADSHEVLAERLAAFAMDRPTAGITTGTTTDQPPRLVFVFPGQGGQWLGMGLRLAATEPVFAAALARCSEAIERETGWSLLDVLEAPEERSRLDEIAVVQPAIFAVQVALADLLAHWGLRPDVVIGHSMGEIAAAHVAGILSLEDATAVICRRSQLLKRVAGKGAMGVVELSLDEARDLIAPFDGRLSVASSNGPTTTVIAGEEAALDEALQIAQGRKVFARRVRVDVASHSPQVDPLLSDLEATLADLRPQPAKTGFVSTVTGVPAAGPEMTATYWARNLRQPVLFGPVVADLLQGGEIAFLELSPHPVLLGAVEGAARAAGSRAMAVGALRRDQDDAAMLREAVGALWTAGVPVDWHQVTPGRVVLPLPRYPWQRERFWFTDSDRSTRRTGPVGDFAGPFLGTKLPELAHLPGSRFWQGQFEPPADQDAVIVSGVPILPGAAAALMAHAAVAEIGGGAVENLTIETQPFLTAPVETQTVVTPSGDQADVRMFIRTDDNESWTLWATARTSGRTSPSGALDIEALQTQLSSQPDVPSGISEVWRGATETLGRLEPARGEIGPAMLLHNAGRLLLNDPGDCETFLAGADLIALHDDLDNVAWVFASRRKDEPAGDLLLLAEDGSVIGEFRGVRLQAPDDEFQSRAASARIGDWLYTVEWQPIEVDGQDAPATGNWLILADDTQFGSQVATALEGRGAQVHLLNTSTYAPESLSDLMGDVLGRDEPNCAGVVDLRSLHGPRDELPIEATRAYLPALSLAQALARIRFSVAPRLWLVTRGAQAVDGPPENPPGAALWGLGRVIANEHPELWGGLVDLGPEPDDREAEWLCTAILGARGETEIAVRDGRRFAGRLARSPELACTTFELRPDATYLITGGAGGLGLALARWMVDNGAQHLALTGRRPLSPEIGAAVSRLESAGTRVTYLRGDISCPNDVASIFATLTEEMPPVGGIVHAAGVLADATLLQQTPEAFETVLSPKVTGARNLVESASGLPLDFLVFFSSASALLGTPGQANYAATNSILDAYSARLRATGIPALSIAWGRWGDVGLATSETNAYSLGRLGMLPMPPAAGVAAFGRVLKSDVAHLAIIDIDWSTYLAGNRSGAPRFELVSDATAASTTESTGGAEFLSRLEAAALEERGDLLLEHIRALAAAVLHFDDPGRVLPGRGFFQMGMDSLTAVELKNRLQQSLQLNLPTTAAFDYPTPTTLAAYLLDELFPDVPAATESNGVEAEVDELVSLSRDELRELLDAELESLNEEIVR